MPRYRVTFRVIASYYPGMTPWHESGGDWTDQKTVEAPTPEAAAEKVIDEEKNSVGGIPDSWDPSVDVTIQDVTLIEEPETAQQEELAEQEEEFFAIALFRDRIRVVELAKDGQYRFIDGTEKTHNII